jgi:hypothetical protein
MNRQTYRRQERENGNERPAGKRYPIQRRLFPITLQKPSSPPIRV